MQILRLISAECKKVKHTPLLWMHIVIPLIGITAFLFDFTLSHSSSVSQTGGYLQVLAMVFPLLIGVICAMCIDEESQAGNFQVLFTSSNPKVLAFLGKLIFVFFLGMGAVMIAAIGYHLGIMGIFHKNPFPLKFYIIASCILIGSNLFEYVFHLFLSMRFGKSASIGMGIAEMLISAILNTDLGDKIWVVIPCTWGMRFVTTWTNFASKSALAAQRNMMASQTSAELHAGIVICIAATAACIIFACIWFSLWEGRRSED